MPRQFTQITNINNRLNKKLTPVDRESITHILVDHMVAYNLNAADLDITDEFIDVLLPRLARENVDWEGLNSIRDIYTTEVKRRFFDHLRNLKRQGTKLNHRVTAAKDLFDDETVSYESVSKLQKSEKPSHSPILKQDHQTPDGQEQFKTPFAPSASEPPAAQHEPMEPAFVKQLNLYPIEKKFSAKQIALIDNEIELDTLVVAMKVCKGKWKAMTKRLEQLKRLSDAHSFNPAADSE